VEQLQPGAIDAPVADLAPLQPSDLVSRLQLQLDQLTPDNREQVDALTAALTGLAVAPSRACADLLLRLLEEGKLQGLEDSRGRTARAAAVEALLGMGYPYALELAPEDLEHLRAETRRLPLVSRVGAVALVLALTSLQGLLGWLWEDEVALVHAIFTAVSAVAVALPSPSRWFRWGARLSLVAAGLAGVGLQLTSVLTGVLNDKPVSLLTGLAALIAAAMMSRKR